MDALIIVAVVLVVAGLLVSVILWLRNPGSAGTEYVTVAELQARLEHEQDEPEETAEPAGTEPPEATATDRAARPEPETTPAAGAGSEAGTLPETETGGETGPRSGTETEPSTETTGGTTETTGKSTTAGGQAGTADRSTLDQDATEHLPDGPEQSRKKSTDDRPS